MWSMAAGDKTQAGRRAVALGEVILSLGLRAFGCKPSRYLVIWAERTTGRSRGAPGSDATTSTANEVDHRFNAIRAPTRLCAPKYKSTLRCMCFGIDQSITIFRHSAHEAFLLLLERHASIPNEPKIVEGRSHTALVHHALCYTNLTVKAMLLLYHGRRGSSPPSSGGEHRQTPATDLLLPPET